MKNFFLEKFKALKSYTAQNTRAVKLTGGALILFLVILSLYIFVFSAPANFPVNVLVLVKKDKPLTEISASLKKQSLVRSSFVFNNIVIALGGEKKIIAGDYTFNKPLNAFGLARRLVKGEQNVPMVKVKIVEGLNVFEIEKILQSKLGKVNPSEFFLMAKEGYLFPDTYSFFLDTETSQVINSMRTNFDRKIKENWDAISSFDKPLEDVITMASIVEEEANSVDSKKMVAGILWHRIDIKMPLQVDATFKYINGKVSSNLTKTDFRINSSYNTHKNKGLPPTPISNPGLATILAVVSPTKSKNLYFLSDNDGNMYYSPTYEQHKKYKSQYLSY